MEGYSPDSRSITVKSFESTDYPLAQGIWTEFEQVEFPMIESIQMDESIQKGIKLDIPVKTKNSTEIHYFLSNSQGKVIISGIQDVHDNHAMITIEGNETENLPIGPNML